jgi:pimeloyl-ACP methyl ester carboxylesterase
MLEVRTIESALVPSPVTYSLLRPEDRPGLPVLLWLHGGGGSHEFLEQTRPLFEDLWAEGALPPMVVATPSAGRSLYLDVADGSEQWEQFMLHELLPEVRQATAASPEPASTAIAGVSMGGMGSLRMAFRHPELFAVVAAIEPGMEPTEHWDEMLPRDRLYRDDALLASLYGDPIDRDHYRRNHPLHLVDRNGPAIVAAGLSISLECGDEDLFYLFHGAEALHRRLFDHAIPHDFHLVRGGDHVGPTVTPRITETLRFVGQAVRPGPPPDAPEVGLLRAFVASQQEPTGYEQSLEIYGSAGLIEVSTIGNGPPVLLLPSLGRGSADFADLAGRLGVAGYEAILPQPRGIGRSEGLHPQLTMQELAEDVAAVIDTVAERPAVVVGHAFGNRVARMTAAEHPDLVAGVVCLAAGGLVAPAPEVWALLAAVFDESLPADEHAAAVAKAFFAPGNDPHAFLDGWHADVAAAQRHATQSTDVEEWWTAGSAPVLVVQGTHDVIASRVNAERLAEAAPDRVEILDLPNAGHGMLPEQPAAVATAVLGWLSRQPHWHP